MAHATKISEAEFGEKVLANKGTVVVDFYADWCAPCKLVATALEEFSGEYGDRLDVVKIDVEHADRIVGEYGVQTLPTLMFFRDGRPVHMVVGAQTKPALRAHIEKCLNGVAVRSGVAR
jgi:thioredoxin 1